MSKDISILGNWCLLIYTIHFMVCVTQSFIVHLLTQQFLYGTQWSVTLSVYLQQKCYLHLLWVDGNYMQSSLCKKVFKYIDLIPIWNYHLHNFFYGVSTRSNLCFSKFFLGNDLIISTITHINKVCLFVCLWMSNSSHL